MSQDNYLKEYERAVSKDLSRGPGGSLRRMLDRKAVRAGQRDRHALFLKRVLGITGIGEGERIKVLEIGCGDGKAISYTSPAVEYYAIDRGGLYRDDLEKRGVRFTEMDVAHSPLPFPERFFDVIMLNHLIEHLAEYDLFVSELHRVLIPGRYLYIRTPDIKRVGFTFYDDYTHVKPYTRNSLDHLMRAYGFRLHTMLYSDHARITIDLLTEGKFRKLLFGRRFGGKEIETLYIRD